MNDLPLFFELNTAYTSSETGNTNKNTTYK